MHFKASVEQKRRLLCYFHRKIEFLNWKWRKSKENPTWNFFVQFIYHSHRSRHELVDKGDRKMQTREINFKPLMFVFSIVSLLYKNHIYQNENTGFAFQKKFYSKWVVLPRTHAHASPNQKEDFQMPEKCSCCDPSVIFSRFVCLPCSTKFHFAATWKQYRLNNRGQKYNACIK